MSHRYNQRVRLSIDAFGDRVLVNLKSMCEEGNSDTFMELEDIMLSEIN